MYAVVDMPHPIQVSSVGMLIHVVGNYLLSSSLANEFKDKSPDEKRELVNLTLEKLRNGIASPQINKV